MGEGSEGLRAEKPWPEEGRGLWRDLCKGWLRGGRVWGQGLSWAGAGLGLEKERRDGVCRKWSQVTSQHSQEDEGGLRSVCGEVDLCSPGK